MRSPGWDDLNKSLFELVVSSYETEFLLKELQKDATDNVLVVNPSPDMIRKINEEHHDYKIVYVILPAGKSWSTRRDVLLSGLSFYNFIYQYRRSVSRPIMRSGRLFRKSWEIFSGRWKSMSEAGTACPGDPGRSARMLLNGTIRYDAHPEIRFL